MKTPPALAATFAHLPRAFAILVPEIVERTWPGETRADCARCVMTPAVSGEAPDGPWSFHPDGRCCTYRPGLANFLAGRALRRGGAGAARIADRVTRPAGVTAWGIRAGARWQLAYARDADERFGRDLSLRCPYWVGGDHACGIWSDRPSTCRTWYCKHDDGLAGAALWAQLQRVLAHVETLLADFCIGRGQPPAPAAHPTGERDGHAMGEPASEPGAAADHAPVEPAAWLDWYRWCGDRVDAATDDELAALADRALRSGRDDLITLARRPRSELPDVVVPSVESTFDHPRGVRISGYSRYDTAIVPRSVFAFLAELDGRRTWRQARDRAARTGAEPLPDATVRELHRIGALEAPGAISPTVLTRTPWPGPH